MMTAPQFNKLLEALGHKKDCVKPVAYPNDLPDAAMDHLLDHVRDLRGRIESLENPNA